MSTHLQRIMQVAIARIPIPSYRPSHRFSILSHDLDILVVLVLTLRKILRIRAVDADRRR